MKCTRKKRKEERQRARGKKRRPECEEGNARALCLYLCVVLIVVNGVLSELAADLLESLLHLWDACQLRLEFVLLLRQSQTRSRVQLRESVLAGAWERGRGACATGDAGHTQRQDRAAMNENNDRGGDCKVAGLHSRYAHSPCRRPEQLQASRVHIGRSVDVRRMEVCCVKVTVELKQMSVIFPQRRSVRHGQHGGRRAHGLVHAAFHVDAHGGRAFVQNGKVGLDKPRQEQKTTQDKAKQNKKFIGSGVRHKKKGHPNGHRHPCAPREVLLDVFWVLQSSLSRVSLL